MQLMALLGVGAFCVVSTLIGVRLFSLWWCTRLVPELLGALALLGIGPLGFGLVVLSGQLESVSTVLADVCWAIAAGSVTIGSMAAYEFTRQIFHMGSRPAAWWVSTLAVLLIGCWFGELFAAGFRAAEPSSLFTRISDFLRTGALLWGAASSLRYYGLSRRRLRIGLTDQYVTDRFLLWGLGLLCVGVAGSVDSLIKVLVLDGGSLPPLMLLNAISGLLAAIAIYLAFIPERPLAWIRAEASPVA